MRLVTASRGLLISWAMVAARRPVAASFSLWRRADSWVLREVMSCTVPTMPMMSDEPGAKVATPLAETQVWMPSGLSTRYSAL